MSIILKEITAKNVYLYTTMPHGDQEMDTQDNQILANVRYRRFMTFTLRFCNLYLMTGCDCNGHADSCHFEQQIWSLTEQSSGGVCDDCRHNTTGRRCERCKIHYFRRPDSELTDPDVCEGNFAERINIESAFEKYHAMGILPRATHLWRFHRPALLTY